MGSGVARLEAVEEFPAVLEDGAPVAPLGLLEPDLGDPETAGVATAEGAPRGGAEMEGLETGAEGLMIISVAGGNTGVKLGTRAVEGTITLEPPGGIHHSCATAPPPY